MPFAYNVHNLSTMYINGIHCKYNDVSECCNDMINDH
jgi:hypothetical protein